MPCMLSDTLCVHDRGRGKWPIPRPFLSRHTREDDYFIQSYRVGATLGDVSKDRYSECHLQGYFMFTSSLLGENDPTS